MIITVETVDKSTISGLLDLFNKNKTKDVFISEDSYIRLKGLTETRNENGLILLEFILTLSTGVSASLIANWLYDKFKNNKAKITFDHVEITFDRDKIKKIITQHIEEN